jgi:hypothetical protein
MQDQARQAVNDNSQQMMSGRLGVISSYDEVNHTATVMISGEKTDVIEDILQNVMCPVTLGIQGVAPSPGRECWVVFKDNNISQPLITHYYNHRYSQYDYSKQTQANYGLPNYLLGI